MFPAAHSRRDRRRLAVGLANRVGECRRQSTQTATSLLFSTRSPSLSLHPLRSFPLQPFLARDTPRSRDYIVKCSFCARFFFLKNANSKLETRFAREKGEFALRGLFQERKKRGEGRERRRKEKKEEGEKSVGFENADRSTKLDITWNFLIREYI